MRKAPKYVIEVRKKKYAKYDAVSFLFRRESLRYVDLFDENDIYVQLFFNRESNTLKLAFTGMYVSGKTYKLTPCKSKGCYSFSCVKLNDVGIPTGDYVIKRFPYFDEHRNLDIYTLEKIAE